MGQVGRGKTGRGTGSGRGDRVNESKREEGKKLKVLFCHHQCYYIQSISKYMQIDDIIKKLLTTLNLEQTS